MVSMSVTAVDSASGVCSQVRAARKSDGGGGGGGEKTNASVACH